MPWAFPFRHYSHRRFCQQQI